MWVACGASAPSLPQQGSGRERRGAVDPPAALLDQAEAPEDEAPLDPPRPRPPALEHLRRDALVR